MDTLRIVGGKPLKGTVRVSGAKNAALPIFAAALLTEERCVISNVPDLSDVHFMAQILTHLGAEVNQIEPDKWEIKAKSVADCAPYDLVRKMRASVCLMGPLLGRLGRAKISLPGGCVFGPRPIDLHLKGFEKLGCNVSMDNGYIHLNGKGQMRGAQIFLGGRNGSTVTGTENVLMAAVLTPGITIIDSAACEPEVTDLCNMLVKMGAKIDGIGSHRLVVKGVESLHGCEHTIIGDRIEAGTFLIMGLIEGNEIKIEGAQPDHLGALFHQLEEADIHILPDNSIYARGTPGRLISKEIVTLPYPGFSTDLQAQLMTLMVTVPGISIITEKIYPNRFMHVSELQRMGAQISLEGPSAIINGGKKLTGAPVMASDLRASAALVIAALIASGETVVQRVYHLARGYAHFDKKLQSLGASVSLVSDEALAHPSIA